MTQKIVNANKISLWTESFGSHTNPCVLLIAASGAQAIFWPKEFCEEIANSGYFVIRYDNRDTGLSTHIDYHKTPYSLLDLTLDALAILDVWNVNKAHVVGFSMGGYIAQLLAIHFQERLYSLTSIASSCNTIPLNNAFSKEKISGCTLPGPTQAFIEGYHKTQVTEKEKIAWSKVLNGPVAPFNTELRRDYLRRVAARAQPSKTSSNHSCARNAFYQDRSRLLSLVRVPALIIHGDQDPVFPLEHAHFTKKYLKNSELIIVPGMGHLFNPAFQQEISRYLISFFRKV